jgi:7-cyano-7-deazaguanine synthase
MDSCRVMSTALLLSGGMDSISLAWWKRPDLAFTLDYGQQAAATEIAVSAKICSELQIEHHVISVDCSSLGSGDMAAKRADRLAPASDWWPYRNQLLITLASMRAVSLGVSNLYIGTVRSDEGHLDGTVEFVRLMDALQAYQEGFLRVEAPAIGFSTAELVREANVPMSVLAWAHSCHRAEIACGQCRGCNKYIETLHELENALDSPR